MSQLKKINEFLWQGSYGNTIYISHNKSKRFFLIIKTILFIYLQFCFILNQISWRKQWLKQFVYLTLWGFYMTYTYITLSTIYNYIIYYKIKNNEQQYQQQYQPKFTFIPKFLNILFEIVFSVELTITIIYWGIVFPTLENIEISEILSTSQFHGGMLIALWIDNIFNAVQFRKSHLFILAIVSFCYCTVNCIYVFLAQENIYPGLNWVSLFSYLELIAAAVLSLTHYFIGYFVYIKFKKQNIIKKLSNVQYLCEEKEQNENEYDEEEESKGDSMVIKSKLKKSLIQSKINEENKSIQQENYV